MIPLLAIVVVPVAFAGGVLVALDTLGLTQDEKPHHAVLPHS
jgi:ABC-type transporter Mla maintaining outer membrane lipid asymmetry permease subunit MlaE